MSTIKNNSWLKNKINKYQNSEDYTLERQILEITEQICIRLQELGWSKKDLAEKMNVSQALITKLLNGKNNYTLKTLVRLSKLLDLDLNISLMSKMEPELEWFDSKTFDAFENIIISYGETKTSWLKTSNTTFEGIDTHSISKSLESHHNHSALN